MNIKKLPPHLIFGVLVTMIFALALVLRVCLPYDQVFGSGWIKFTGIDAYFQMRIVDQMAHNFPHLLTFDPYIIYPGGGHIGSIHFFNQLLAGIIWVIGFGSPSQHLIDVVGVYFPAVLAALTVIPVYFIGKELFGRWAGIIAASLIAVMPGEYIGRSILGFADTCAAEVLFTTVAVMFLIIAIRVAGQSQLMFNHLKNRDWAVITKPIIYSLLAGLFLGVYMLTWAGALLFIFILAVYFIIQYIINHLKNRPSEYLCIIGVGLFLVPLLFVRLQYGTLTFAALLIAVLIPLVMSGASRLVIWRGWRPFYYPVILIVFGLIGLGIFYGIAPALLKSMLAQFSIFVPSGFSATTTLEMQPIFFPGGGFSLAVVWGNFTTGFYLSIISLVILIYLIIKRGSADKTLLVIWSLVILLATLGQRRFAYYFAVNVAILTAYFSWLFLQFIALMVDWLAGRIRTAIDFKERLVMLPEMTQMTLPAGAGAEKQPEKGHGEASSAAKYVIMGLAVIVVFILVFVFNIASAVGTAKQARFAPSDAWQSSLTWLKENSPDPFADPDFYYELYQSSSAGERYQYPETAYGVMSWWDYGYWITRIAHRLPNANPGQSPEPIIKIANFFLTQEEAQAQEIIKELDSQYIVIDHMMTSSKFWAIATWADREQTDFFDAYYLPYEGQLVPVRLFHPGYYRSILTRLYNFDGEAVEAESPLVVSYEEKVDNGGNAYKQITEVQDFPTYEEALDYMQSLDSPGYRLVGGNPFISPVPLEALTDYKLVHSSKQLLKQQDVGFVPEVKIFEYTGN